MKNIAPGLSLKKYKGNKHEQGGIMVNALGNKTKDINKAVAEVEGGEYNYRYNPTNPKDNYILSEQLGIANMAKQADRFKNNDRISYNTRTNLLNKSVKLNEVLKAQQEQSQMQQAALGGMLKRYDPGGLIPTSNRAVSTPENELTNVPMQPIAPLLSGSQKFNLPTKIQSVNPKITSDTKALDVSKEMQQAQTAASKQKVKGVTSGLSGIASAFGPIGQGVGAAIQLAPYAIDLGKAMFDKTAVQDLQTQGSAMKLPNTTYAKNGGKLNVKPLPKYILGDNINTDPLNPYGTTKVFNNKNVSENLVSLKRNIQKIGDYSFDSNKVTRFTDLQRKLKEGKIALKDMVYITEDDKAVMRNDDGTYRFYQPPSPVQKKPSIGTTTTGQSVQPPTVNPSTTTNQTTPVVTQKTQAEDDAERIKEYDRTIGIPNALKSFYSNQGLTPNIGTNAQNSLDVVEQPKQRDKLSEMLKSGLMLKGSAMAGSLFNALQPAQKETLRLPDFGRADDAMSKATGFSMNPALNEVEQARGKSQEAIRNMATTAGQYTSNMQSVNQRAGQQAAGLRVQEQQIMNQLAAQKAGYETQKASAIQQELARFDENTLMNKAATQDARVAFVENINNLGTEIMKQGNEQDIASEQDKLAVQNAKLKIIQSAFENPDVISGANLEKMLKMIQEGDYTNIPKLFGQPSDTRKTLKAEADRQAREAASKK